MTNENDKNDLDLAVSVNQEKRMTVAELIEKLKEVPQDLRVMSFNGCCAGEIDILTIEDGILFMEASDD